MSKKYFYFCLLIYFFFSINGLVRAADTSAPSSVLTVNPTSPNGENGWFITSPNITITSSDDLSGVRAINYKINNDAWVRSEYFSGFNLINNPSFENGYISDWTFVGPFISVGYKSSLFYRTGNYSAGIISLSPFSHSHFQNSDYLVLDANTTYTYSMYLRSITSFLDNGFVDVVSKVGSVDTLLSSTHNIDLKFNYKQVTGTFTTTSNPNARIFIKVGIRQLGHLSIEDVSISKAASSPSVNFLLNREGVNTLLFYAEDGAGNIETTKQATIKVDTVRPNFLNFRVVDQDDIKKFSSSIDTLDNTSGLLSTPVLFNYSVNGLDDGYFENYGSCSGSFLEDQFINPSVSFSTGDNTGSITTPKIDYCDSNWVNCKKLNFYVKDLAGNIASHIICVNGPYITSSFGDAFGRSAINQMGIGANYNIWGIASSSGLITDISVREDLKIQNYVFSEYLLNKLYEQSVSKHLDTATLINSVSNEEGVFKSESDLTIDSPLSYSGVDQLVFVGGDLDINSNITSLNSNVVYIVNGNVTIGNTVTQVEVGLISTNQVYTAENYDLAEKISISGFIFARNIEFNRNTDRTLGASEIITFPIRGLFSNKYLKDNNIYWREERD